MSTATTLIDSLKGFISFAILIPILVAVHELGHFWAARAFGMKVDAFAVMMGGVRKTPLEKLLDRPLVSSRILWAVGLVSATGLVVAAEVKSEPGIYLAFAALGFMLPIWVVTRMGALYHLPLSSSLGTLAKLWGIAIVLSFVGTRGHGMAPVQLTGLLTLASFVATLIVYYNPVFHKPEEAPHGHGQIEVPADKVDTLDEASGQDPVDGMVRYPVYFRPLLSKSDKHGTEFALLCWPLGGFAAIRGMHPKEDGSETKIEGGFYSKSPVARLVVLFAGPLFSIVFGVLMLTGLKAVSGKPVPDLSPVIGSMSPDGPAEKAGLKVGDKVVRVNGSPVSDFFSVVKAVRTSFRKEGDKNVPIAVSIEALRGERPVAITVVPNVGPEPTPVLLPNLDVSNELAIQAKLGFGPAVNYVPMALGAAFLEAALTPIELVNNLAHSVAKPATLAQNIGGPASIAREVTEASKLGFDVVLMLGGLLSISLGVMNLLPIVPFDGGQMTVAFAELLRGGKRLSLQLQTTISAIGAFLVIILILGVVTLDISHLAPR